MNASSLIDTLNFAFDKRHGVLTYIAKTSLLSICAAFTLLIPVVMVKFYVLHDAIPYKDSPSLLDLLVIAPIFENILFIGLIEFMMAFGLRNLTMVIVISALSGIAHGLAADWRAVSGVIGFATMSHTYLHWYECPFLKRYLITVGQHVLFNTPAAIVLGTTLFD